MAKSSKRKRKARTPAKPYEPTQRETVVGLAFLERLQETPHPPRIKISNHDGVDTISYDHPEPVVGMILQMEKLGITDFDFFHGQLNQLASVGSKGGGVDEESLNFLLSLVKSIEPKDQVEAMLAAQMAVIHNEFMTCARRLARAETIEEYNLYERSFNKLARTFATQLEALKRYRTGGQQKVTVEHVHVHQGGQAIVGNVSHGGRGSTAIQGPTP